MVQISHQRKRAFVGKGKTKQNEGTKGKENSDLYAVREVKKAMREAACVYSGGEYDKIFGTTHVASLD